MRALAPLLALLSALAACSGSGPDPTPATPRPRRARAERAPERAPPAVDDVPPLPPSTFPAPARLVAIGDVHGDLDAFEDALRAAGAIDGDGHWSGGALFVVQTGDLLDRGDQERAILDLAEQLEREALAAGGRFLALDGNHEYMNAQGDFRYATAGGFRDFEDYGATAHGPLFDGIPEHMRGRIEAFRPGGPRARVFATRDTIAMVGTTLFVHGGALAEHLRDGLDAINQDGRAFFLGQAPLSPDLAAEDGPIWYRGFAMDDGEATCARVDEALAVAHAERMVIGHTKQPSGITFACEGRVVRIDVGLARIYDGPIEVLEIVGDETRVLRGTRTVP